MGFGRLLLLFGVLLPSLLLVVAYDYNYCGAPQTWGKSVKETHKMFRDAGLTLTKVILNIRHGDRTPVATFPATYQDSVVWNCSLNTLGIFSEGADPSVSLKRIYRKLYLPNRQILPGDCLFGQLTEVGMEQHRVLGEAIHDLYVRTGFLSPTFNSSEWWIRSTDVPRTLASAQSLLLGMYPGSAVQGSLPVVAMSTMDNSLENMTPNDHLCPALAEIYKKLMKTAEWQKHLNETAPMVAKVKAILGVPSDYSLDIWDVADVVHARVCHNMSLPDGMDSLRDALWAAATWEQAYLYSTFDALSLGIGSFVGEQLQRLDEAVAGIGPQMIFYSGHDTSVWPLSFAYGFGNWKEWPPYASHMMLELWKDPSVGQFYINILWNGDKIDLGQNCNRESPCPYSVWRKFVAPFVPNNFKHECMVSNYLEKENGKEKERREEVDWEKEYELEKEVKKFFKLK